MKYINGFSDDSTITLLYRENDKRKSTILTDFEWYFLITAQDFERLKNIFTGNKDKKEAFKTLYNIYKTEKEGNYVKIYVKLGTPRDIKERLQKTLEDHYKIQTYEMDVPLLKRYMLDTQVEIANEYKTLFIDIETDDRNTKIEIGKTRIVSFAGYDGTTEYFFCEDDEKKLLEKAWDCMSQYDLVMGWNSAKFDIPYIVERMKLFKMRKNWETIIHVDLMKRLQDTYRYDRTIRSFSLNNISKIFLGKEKYKLSKTIYELFTTNRETLKTYNIIDCKLGYEINSKFNAMATLIDECRWCNVFISRAYISELIDTFALKYAKKSGKHLFSKKPVTDFSVDSHKYVGGYVFAAKSGLYDDVFVCDFKSLYPSIIRTWNISLETLTTDSSNTIKSIKPSLFFKKQSGILPEIVTYFLTERKKFKKQMEQLSEEGKKDSFEYSLALNNQAIVKELSNSVYGIIGNKYTRYFNIELAECITLAGQYCIKFASKYFESKGHVVLGGDTDSLFVKLTDKNKIDQMLIDFNLALAEHLKEAFGTDACYIELAKDKYFKHFINIIKKNYVGIKVDNGKEELYATGIELIKKDTIEYARKLQEILIYKIFNKATTQNCLDFIKSEKEKFKTVTVNFKEISTTRKISKALESYKSISQHVRLAKRLWNTKENFIGSDISYVIKDYKDKDQVISESEFIGEFDRNYYWKNKIYPCLKRILSVVYPYEAWDAFSDLTEVLKKRRKTDIIKTPKQEAVTHENKS